ncbi:MAG: glycosyltransferase family 2 protein [Candidatus Nanoarchaeia archaeon]|nr:glycosyltransferase family 2 protein [Candidatus Nanoarchaeia archaeon]MDD5741443.1 glycosyltransferase family 2 protein [Candidatus Nanoarchaeia archaeon]
MEKINIIIPMAGRGKRFIDAGYILPKPLLKIEEKEIIAHIIDIMKVPNAQFIFIVRQDHCDEHQLDKKLLELEPNAIIVRINEITQGSICTVLLAKKYFNDSNPVIIKDCDQIINWNPEHFLEFVERNHADGAIVNIHTERPNYSFSRVDHAGRIFETAEKSVISNHGSVGIYYFARGSDLVKYAEKMIEKNIRVNNEFYTSPVYNQFIQDFKLILHYPVAEMFQLGTPEEFHENRNKVIEFLRMKKERNNKNSKFL